MDTRREMAFPFKLIDMKLLPSPLRSILLASSVGRMEGSTPAGVLSPIFMCKKLPDGVLSRVVDSNLNKPLSGLRVGKCDDQDLVGTGVGGGGRGGSVGLGVGRFFFIKKLVSMLFGSPLFTSELNVSWDEEEEGDEFSFKISWPAMEICMKPPPGRTTDDPPSCWFRFGLRLVSTMSLIGSPLVGSTAKANSSSSGGLSEGKFLNGVGLRLIKNSSRLNCDVSSASRGRCVVVGNGVGNDVGLTRTNGVLVGMVGIGGLGKLGN